MFKPINQHEKVTSSWAKSNLQTTPMLHTPPHTTFIKLMCSIFNKSTKLDEAIDRFFVLHFHRWKGLQGFVSWSGLSSHMWSLLYWSLLMTNSTDPITTATNRKCVFWWCDVMCPSGTAIVEFHTKHEARKCFSPLGWVCSNLLESKFEWDDNKFVFSLFRTELWVKEQDWTSVIVRVSLWWTERNLLPFGRVTKIEKNCKKKRSFFFVDQNCCFHFIDLQLNKNRNSTNTI